MKTSFRRAVSFFALCLVASPSSGFAAEDQGLKAGDLVGICGDSITEQKIYSVDIADYLLMCQPQPKVSAIQFGWSGETAPGFLARMKNDTLPFKPTVATTLYGMNDGHYKAVEPATLDAYREAMTGIVETLKANGVRFIVVGTPGAVDTYYYHRDAKETADVLPQAGVYNNTLEELGKVGKEIAAKEGVAFADVHSAMIDAMTKAKAANGARFSVCGMDGVHPRPDGHIIMAYALLKGLGCDGNIGTITVDLKAGTASATDGTKVLSCANGVVELESTRYPFCFYGDDLKNPESTRSILPFLPFNAELNRYMLVVKNPTAKSLKITWGTDSKTFTADQLAAGVNLADEFWNNPFSKPFAEVQQKIADQQAFETSASKVMLHSLPEWYKSMPELKEQLDQFPTKIVSKWETLSAASAAAVVPVKHEIRIEAAP
jgi:lysophospholipase L1-like esterase